MRISRRGGGAAAGLLVAALLALAATPSAGARPNASEHERRCVLALLEGGTEATPAELTAPLEAPVLASFAVLRRAEQPADEIPPLSTVGEVVDSQIRSWYPAYTRSLGTIGMHSYYLIPGYLKEEQLPPASCMSAKQRAERPQLVELSRKRANELAFCIAQADSGTGGVLASNGGSSSCQPFADVESGVRLFLGGLGTAPTLELAPDGVASVRFRFKTLPALLAPVHENVYSFAPAATIRKQITKLIESGIESASPKLHLPKRGREAREKRLTRRLRTLIDDAEPSAVEWLAADGSLVRALGRPNVHVLEEALG